jgi:hypothetical protein
MKMDLFLAVRGLRTLQSQNRKEDDDNTLVDTAIQCVIHQSNAEFQEAGIKASFILFICSR